MVKSVSTKIDVREMIRFSNRNGEEIVKRGLKSIGVGAAVVASILLSSTSAQAATTGKGKSYYGCTNTVKMWRSGGTIYANAKQVCAHKMKTQRPSIALSGNNGKTFVSKIAGCKKTKTCSTPTVKLKATKKWTYRASNSGTGSFASQGPGDFWWPVNTVAHATYKYK